jgi:hypothetical protein
MTPKYVAKYIVRYREYGIDSLGSEVHTHVVEARNVYDAAKKLRSYLDRLDPFFGGIEICGIDNVGGFIR